MKNEKMSLLQKARLNGADLSNYLNLPFWNKKVDVDNLLKEYIKEMNNFIEPPKKMIENGELSWVPSQRILNWIWKNKEYFTKKIATVTKWDKQNPTLKDKVPKEVWQEYLREKKKGFCFDKKEKCERCCREMRGEGTQVHHLDYISGQLSNKEYLRELCDDCHIQVHKLIFTETGKRNIDDNEFSEKYIKNNWQGIDFCILERDFLDSCQKRANATGKDFIAELPAGKQIEIKAVGSGSTFTKFLKKQGLLEKTKIPSNKLTNFHYDGKYLTEKEYKEYLKPFRIEWQKRKNEKRKIERAKIKQRKTDKKKIELLLKK